jgi:hypothetical protein
LPTILVYVTILVRYRTALNIGSLWIFLLNLTH